METLIQTELILALVLLVGVVSCFALEKVKIEVTSTWLLGIVLFFCTFGMEKWPSAKELLLILSSEAPLAILAMFIVSGALSKQGIVERLTSYLEKLTRFGFHPFMLLLLTAVACFSAFINNTPVVVILLPVAIGLSRTLGVASSKLLLPISYASIFGGCCTLIGTSTNIVASGFMSSSNYYPHMGPMGMFELTKIGFPLMILGIAFVILFGKKLLPEREALSKIIAEIDRKEFITEAIVVKNSSMVGQLVKNSSISKIAGVRLLDVVREGKGLSMPLPDILLSAGDRLILSCKPQGLIDAREVQGFKFFDQADLGIEQINTSEAIMVEAMIKPTSGLLSQTLTEADFRGRFNLTVVALHRRGKNLRLRLNQLKLEIGDTLLLLGPELSVESLRVSGEAVLLDKAPLLVDKKPLKSAFAVGALLVIIAIATLGMLPLYAVALLAAGFLVLSNSINFKEAIRSVEWNLLLLIYAMLALGLVMEKSGASALLADLIKTTSTIGLAEEWQVIGALVILYLFTALLTELLSNNATIAIMTPVALMVAFQFDLNTSEAKAFVLACCVAASASFMTPIGYQTNTFVYTVGGYRFKDFAKFGIWPML
ncbi:MAG: SLC13 family permease, partial [Opitutae bacterium]